MEDGGYGRVRNIMETMGQLGLSCIGHNPHLLSCLPHSQYNQKLAWTACINLHGSIHSSHSNRLAAQCGCHRLATLCSLKQHSFHSSHRHSKPPSSSHHKAPLCPSGRAQGRLPAPSPHTSGRWPAFSFFPVPLIFKGCVRPWAQDWAALPLESSP